MSSGHIWAQTNKDSKCYKTPQNWSAYQEFYRESTLKFMCKNTQLNKPCSKFISQWELTRYLKKYNLKT